MTALLALARLGAVIGPGGVLVDEESVGELGWDDALRLGRTDPAAAVPLATDDPWDAGRTVGQLVAQLDGVALPTSAQALVAVLRSSVTT